MTYTIIRTAARPSYRRLSGEHHFWIENETGRLVIGDQSEYDDPDGGQPTYPPDCYGGVFYVDVEQIRNRGGFDAHCSGQGIALKCPILSPKGKKGGERIVRSEARWILNFLQIADRLGE